MPPEGIDQAADAFRESMHGTEKVQPRDDSGRFTESKPRPEPLFRERQTEGDEFGDVSDGGEDARMRRQEERANGEPFEDAVSDDRGKSRTPKPVRTSGDKEHEGTDEEQGGTEDESDDDESGGDEEPDEGEGTDRETGDDAESGARYEVTVDGQPKEVTLREALDGYIRQETFHQRMNQVGAATQAVSVEAQRVAQMRDMYIQQVAILEQEVATLLPKEPNWDELYASDPRAAHGLRKQYDAVNGKLYELRQGRERAMAERSNESARTTETYAKNEFARFVTDSKIPDEASLRKEIGHMRQTAMKAGFTENEVSTVYDSRMLKILRKASKYDRLMAKTPKAVVPGKGRTLTPGSVGRVSNAGRRDINEAQSRLAKSGRLDDAAAVFEKFLR